MFLFYFNLCFYVDYGTAIPEASDDYASEALVFLICGVKGHWKHPVGYFLQNKISADVQAQLTNSSSYDWIISRLAIDHHYDNEIVPKFTWLYLSFKL